MVALNNDKPFAYDTYKFAEITKSQKYRSLYDVNITKALKSTQKEFDQEKEQIRQFVDKNFENARYVQQTLETDANCTYNK